MPIRKRWSPRRKAPELPDEPGAYELANNRGKIQYIGKADNLARRVQQQLRDPTKARRVAKLRVQEGRNPEALEKKLVRRYQELHEGKLPPLNEQKP
jgi:excinuclease UvrABC nuclease subunit